LEDLIKSGRVATKEWSYKSGCNEVKFTLIWNKKNPGDFVIIIRGKASKKVVEGKNGKKGLDDKGDAEDFLVLITGRTVERKGTFGGTYNEVDNKSVIIQWIDPDNIPRTAPPPRPR
jgi:hypothetical protein